MIKQMTVRTCQVKSDPDDPKSPVMTVPAGHIFYQEKMHTHAVPIKGRTIDFITAGEAELFAIDFDLKEAKRVIKETYGVPLKATSKTPKEKIVSAILDIRFRHENPSKPV